MSLFIDVDGHEYDVSDLACDLCGIMFDESGKCDCTKDPE